ncbi:hypothetical protein [Moorella sp. Hama-1]|uniref:hypothetical protein n=1 Tax=Moorella sp. Hama-1 TaxID=2138101 RepID=UPI000D65504F|nr:hypothetical protein [Moorella sp. Hama-1]BCV20951.1 hypothetical protein hamaS1_10200 [Moorella sp. Hama-1]
MRPHKEKLITIKAFYGKFLFTPGELAHLFAKDPGLMLTASKRAIELELRQNYKLKKNRPGV